MPFCLCILLDHNMGHFKYYVQVEAGHARVKMHKCSQISFTCSQSSKWQGRRYAQLSWEPSVRLPKNNNKTFETMMHRK